MDQETKRLVGEALFSVLSEFHKIEDATLRAVRHVWTEDSLDRIILDFGSRCLVIAADQNDDTVDISVATTIEERCAGDDSSHSAAWASLLGKKFFWGWVTVNQQGYCDGVLLSFDGIKPQIFLNVIASSFNISSITDR